VFVSNRDYSQSVFTGLSGCLNNYSASPIFFEIKKIKLDSKSFFFYFRKNWKFTALILVNMMANSMKTTSVAQIFWFWWWRRLHSGRQLPVIAI